MSSAFRREPYTLLPPDVPLEPVERRPTAAARLMIEVLTTEGRAASVEIHVRRDVVEVWHRQRCAGVYVRDMLRDWFENPIRPYQVDDVTFSLDRMVDRNGRIAITLPDVTAWALSPVDSGRLRELLQ
jgi:hypothetical protein